MNKQFPGRSADFPDTVPMFRPGEESGFVDTEPLPLANVRAPAPAPEPLEPVPAGTSIDRVVAAVRKDNRVCPQPTRWLEFYLVLEHCSHGAALPAAPLVGAAWTATPALAKRMCFREQLEWADAHGCLERAWEFLEKMPEADWHRMD